MLYRDRADDALRLIYRAQEGARDATGPRVRAMLHTCEVWAYAARGRIAGLQRATIKVAEVLADVDANGDEPYWITYFDEAELAESPRTPAWNTPCGANWPRKPASTSST